MSISSRVSQFFNAAGGSMNASIGLAKDLATAPWKADDFDGFLGATGDAFKKNTSEVIKHSWGPQGTVGTVIGALPAPVRSVGRSVVKGVGGAGADVLTPVAKTLERVYNNVVSHPGSALFQAMALSQNAGYSDADDDSADISDSIKTLFKKQTWQDAWDISDEYSIGQSYALYNATSVDKSQVGEDSDRLDLRDSVALQKFMGSDDFKYMSGKADFLSRIFLDPTIIGGKMLMAARGVRVVTKAAAVTNLETGATQIVNQSGRIPGLPALSIQTRRIGQIERGAVNSVTASITGAKNKSPMEQIAEAVDSRQFLRANLDMEGKSGAYIAQRYFADEADGGLIGELMATAGTVENRTNLTRFLLGDKAAYAALKTESTALTNQLDRLYGEVGSISNPARHYNTLPEQQRILDEIDELYPNTQNLARRERVWGSIDQVPTMTRMGGVRTAVTRSESYQSGVLSKTLRVINRKAPQGILRLNDDNSYTQVQRQLERSNLSRTEQDQWLSEYASALTPEAKGDVYRRLEKEAVKSIFRREQMTENGMRTVSMSDEEIEVLLEKAKYHEGYSTANKMLDERTYDGNPNRSMVSIHDEDGFEQLHVPIWETQNARVVTMMDLDALRKADRFRPDSIRQAGQITEELLQTYNKVWKAATLIRLGYPMRVQADQQMRIMAKIGALTQVHNLGQVGEEVGRGIAAAVRNSFAKGELGTNSVVRVNEHGLGRIIHRFENGQVAVKMRDGSILNTTIDEIRFARVKDFGIGQSDLRVRNNVIRGAFSYRRDEEAIAKALISGRSSMEALTGKSEKGILGRLLNPREEGDIELPNGLMFAGSHTSIAPDNALSYGPAWTHAVNNVIGQSIMGRKLLAGETPEQLIHWLKKTKEGRDAMRRMSMYRTDDVDQWVHVMDDAVQTYLDGNPALMKLALEGRAKFDDLKKAVPDLTQRPTVHGQQLMQATRTSESVKLYDSFVRKAFHLLATAPDDILARQPLYNSLYNAEAERLVHLLDDGVPLNDEALEMIATRARTKAVRDTQDLMYDMANQTDLARHLRFISPFFSAWQDSMTRWGGNIIERPDFVARIGLLWSAPERAGMVRDENGMIVNKDGTITDPATGLSKEAEGNVGKQRYIVMMAPDWLRETIPGMERSGQLAFNKKTFNLIAQASPGVGPLGAVPINELVKKAPASEDMFKWALPYGAQHTKDLLTPTIARRIDTAMDEEHETQAKLALQLHQTAMTEWMLEGGGPDRESKPKYEDALEQAKQQSWVKVMAGLVLPFVPTTQSPYQLYIDAYRRASASQRENPAALGMHVDGVTPISADEWFSATYGKELFYLTQGLTKTYDGVAPTAGGKKRRDKYKALVENHPNLGGFITGADGAGALSGEISKEDAEFLPSFYRTQMENDVAPGSEHKQREVLSGQGWEYSAEAKMGWQEYTAAMDMIDAELLDRGLTSITQTKAKDIKAVKDGIVASLTAKYPSWRDDFDQTDRGAYAKRLADFEAVTQDPDQMLRAEVQGVKQYLDTRKVIVAELQRRKGLKGGSATITDPTNTDVLATWDNFVSDLVDSNPPFGQTYHRYFDNDQMD